MPAIESNKGTPQPAIVHPFRRAVLRGLGVALPPLLTIVVLLWAWNLIQGYVLEPLEGTANWAIQQVIWDGETGRPRDSEVADHRQLSNDQWIDRKVYDFVQIHYSGDQIPQTAPAYYRHYVELRYLRRTTVIPLFLALFTLILYLLGKFLAAGIGRLAVATFDGIIQRLPVIRNVYSAVKQVTDFVFTEQEIEFNRVVALEYPRKGIWSVGFVTGESMLDIQSAANEPVVTVLMPTSPMPATGFTITVRKSETIDLDITIDQAIQFVVSCGVVVPLQQQHGQASVAPALFTNPQLVMKTAQLPSPNGASQKKADAAQEAADHTDQAD